MAKRQLTKQLKTLPDAPGVYLFKDSEGRIIYVGKARSLTRRVRSYFSKSHADAKTLAMVSRIADLDFYVVGSEVESLILEVNLIKQHRPAYNVNYRDDKSYPYIAIDLETDFPCVRSTREKHKPGPRYFGPFTNAAAVRETLNTLRKVFPVRSCRGAEPGKSTGCPCLDYHIERCLGPCIEAVSKEEYRKMIDQIVAFLDGRQDEVIEELEAEMKRASEAMEYEHAALLRNRIKAAEHVRERQKIVSEARLDQDIIGIVGEEELACAMLLAIREGKMVATEEFVLDRGAEDTEPELLAGFLKNYYSTASHIPEEVLLPGDAEDMHVIEEWLSERRGRRVRLEVPRRAMKKRLVEMADENAALSLARYKAKTHYQEEWANRAIAGLQAGLGLAKPPMRIECFDVSQIGGTSSVGSMVVFENGVAKPSLYRHFRIRRIHGQNDFEMMKQIVARRLKKLVSEDAGRFGERPDLIIVDGGKPQLSAALEAMREVGAEVPVAALAKREEELFLPGRPEPVLLVPGSEPLHLVKRIRDEAHRFAIGYHRQLRGKRMRRSVLDEIRGIGPARKKSLLRHFGSYKRILSADLDALRAVPGISEKTAHSIYHQLHDVRS
ncbi:MAG: excinuclease ABC subunit UvrC [Actinobacteria bacterium]|nr:MAG: excinuclease ABC subunit UvrC [Actinomycetota bacterium]